MQCARDELTHLINAVCNPLPGLSGHIGLSQSHQLTCGSAGNLQRLSDLYDYWRNTYPEAGSHYWSVRTWTLLIWQPVYLSLLGVHLAQRAPYLDAMSQSVTDGFVGGYSLTEHQPRSGSLDELIPFAAGEIVRFIERQLNELSSVLSIYPKLARLLMVDCARAALLLVQRQQALGNDYLQCLEQQWMEALAQPPNSAMIAIPLEDGRVCLALGRKACCQHFRRADGELCSTCPKLKLDERVKRLSEELAAPC